MLLKSYSGDAQYARRLLKSFEKFNIERIPLFIVVPESDVNVFTEMQVSNCTVLSERLFEKHLVKHDVHGIRPGYINQEIVKLAFWELELAANYFCVDSDAEFIREFRVSDFMFDSGTPYSVLVQDLELAVNPDYYQQYWTTREHEYRVIAETIGLDTRVLLTCHGHTVFSSKVLKSFVSDFLVPRNWDYVDALELSPYEFTWYNMWLQKSQVIEVHPREPWIKVFHSESQHLEYLMRGVTLTDIARGFLGVVVNSNFSRGAGVIDAGSTKIINIGRYLSYGEVASVMKAKFAETFARRIRKSDR